MKKLLLVLIIMLSGAPFLRAQILIGPKMGINYSKVPTNEKNLPEGNKELIKTGLNIGVAASIPYKNRFGLQSELVFTQKGYRDQWRRKPDLLLVQESVNASYIELVAMPKYTFGGENVKVYVGAGPSIGYWLTGKTEFIRSQDVNLTKVKLDFDSKAADQIDGEKRVEFGINAGTGVLLPSGEGSIIIDLRYNYGITAMRKWSDDFNTNAQWHNSVFSLTFGYLFGL